MAAVLGVSAFYHDAAAAVVVDGEIVAAAQEERFTRVKHDASFPSNAIGYCLDEAGLAPDDLDAVGFYEKPLLKLDRLLETYLAYAPRGFRQFVRFAPAWTREKLRLPREIARGPGWALSQADRVHGASRIPRRQRVLPIPVRRGGDRDAGRRG